jgi:hypothetical protein
MLMDMEEEEYHSRWIWVLRFWLVAEGGWLELKLLGRHSSAGCRDIRCMVARDATCSLAAG